MQLQSGKDVGYPRHKNRLNHSLTFLCCSYAKNQRDFWIGYHQKGNGSWEWHDGSNSSYTNFAPGYPELFSCARTSVDGFWKDKKCDTFLGYICEKPAGILLSAYKTLLHICRMHCAITLTRVLALYLDGVGVGFGGKTQEHL